MYTLYHPPNTPKNRDRCSCGRRWRERVRARLLVQQQRSLGQPSRVGSSRLQSAVSVLRTVVVTTVRSFKFHAWCPAKWLGSCLGKYPTDYFRLPVFVRSSLVEYFRFYNVCIFVCPDSGNERPVSTYRKICRKVRKVWGSETGGRSLFHPTPSNAVRRECEEFRLNERQLYAMMKDMQQDIRNGLKKKTSNLSNIKCYPTYVQSMPDGTERGKFLALDLGGTNFRVLLVELGDNGFSDMKSDIYRVSEDLQVGTGQALFDHIAYCLATFVKKYNIDNENALPLGFTFSFPLRQEGLTRGYLIRWTKGFNCSGVVGHDVVQLLKDAIARRNDVRIDVCAILNDTTGTMMSCGYRNANARIGLIVGTGCNACYVENVDECEFFAGEKLNEGVIVNTEWGAYGENQNLDFLINKYDVYVDSTSPNTGKQRFEKMISGMYMGEIVRLVIKRLIALRVLFGGHTSPDFETDGKFCTSFMSEIERCVL